MQGSKKAPTSEVVEASKADWRNERTTSPPSVSPRRDDRAEPDDDDVGTGRIEVVNVEGGRADSAASGLVSLRRELAKLHQQAAAVEKSLDDQRRDRSESLDRLERATERALMLESRLSGAEAEATALRKMQEASAADLQTLRAERDDLARAVDAAKAATSELGRLKDEVTQLRTKADEAAAAGVELAKAKEAAAQALAEAKQARLDTEKARKALDIAEQDAAMVGEQASKIREEAAKIRVDADKASEELAKARAEATAAREQAAKTAREELKTARDEAAKRAEELAQARADLTRAKEDLARAKEDNTRDRETARDRIDLIERALDDARLASQRTETQLEAARENEERLSRQHEAALARAAQAESRATAMTMAHAALDNSMRLLQEEIAAAFARAAHQAMPPDLPDASFLSVAPEHVESLPPDSVSPPRMGPPPLPPHAMADSSEVSSPASKSVPPPPPNASVAPVASAAPAPPHASLPPHRSMSPPTYASVPPQIHASPLPERHVSSLPPESRRGTAPPGGHVTGPPTHASVPPEARGSIPPVKLVSAHPTSELPPADGWSDSSPSTRRPGAAVPPPFNEASEPTSTTRQDLLAKLVDPDRAAAAAAELQQHPEWLRSVPPPALVAALSSLGYEAEGSIFELARAWDREPLCHSLIAALRAETEPRSREHSAWLLKHLAAPSSWKAIADLARSDDEPVKMRRWLLEALDRLAAGRAIGWRELGEVVTAVARHPDASLRDGVVGILVSLDRSDEKRRLLLDILRADDDEVVLASAVNALASVLPMELDPGLVDHLLNHPSPRVQRSVRDLIERAQHAK